MTKLSTDEQLKASYTQKELVELVERKSIIAQRTLVIGYKRLNKDALIDEIRYLDNIIWNTNDEEDYIEDEGGVVEDAALSPESPLCESCGVDITDGGYSAEWAGNYCSKSHAIKAGIKLEDMEEGLEDGTFFWTDWSEV